MKFIKSNQIKFLLFIAICYMCMACQEDVIYPEFEKWQPYNESERIELSQQNENQQLQYKLIQSPVLDKNELIEVIRLQLGGFTKEMYLELAPLIYENSISTLQQHISDQKLSYTSLTQWYLYRIAILETDETLGLNAIISINPNAVEQARLLDKQTTESKHPIYGMPILLKDNINTLAMKTTAGALSLAGNQPKEDATIVKNLKSHEAIILGKVNLSEWANFLCDGCPNGYSAVGGQTLNPYGISKFDTGGSSSGSAVSVAANYAVAAVGTETSGSILSPSSQQSLVGLKPTLGNLSQDGIVPISSTLDTPGPITRNVSDNAILYAAMLNTAEPLESIISQIENPSNIKFGVIQDFMQDSLYRNAIELLKAEGFQLEVMEPKSMDFNGFLALLNGDMKRDLAAYLKIHTEGSVKSVEDVVQFNSKDSLLNIPYGQARLDGILAQELNDIELDSIRQNLISSGKTYFKQFFETHQVDAVLSINNYNAGQAAVAKYPAITVSMGYSNAGEPKGLTFIAKPNQEQKLFQLASFFEKLSALRVPAKYYDVKKNN